MRTHGVRPDVISYNTAIAACGARAYYKDAVALLSEMWDQGLEPDIISYNSAISACEKGGQWQQALELLGEMKELGPDVISFAAAISACEKGGQWERALALLDECRGTPGVTANLHCFNAAISACEKGGQWERALALLSEMRDPAKRAAKRLPAPDYISYSAAILACARHRKWRPAAELLREAETLGLPLVERDFALVASACEHAAERGDALAEQTVNVLRGAMLAARDIEMM